MRLGERNSFADRRSLRLALGQVGLSQPSGWLPFTTHEALPFNVSTTPVVLFASTISRAMTVRAWWQGVEVVTTNNGSNYWTLTLRRQDTAAILATLTTSAISADTPTVLSGTGLNLSISTSYVALYVQAAKTGSPGALYATGPAVWVT